MNLFTKTIDVAEIHREFDTMGQGNSVCWSTVETTDKSSLFIAAPQEKFDLTGLEKKGKGFFNITKTVVKDPIVFRYVRGGIQVLTKWGEEANDELLALDIDN